MPKYRDWVSRDSLEQQFHDRLCDVWVEVGKRTGYYAYRFVQVLGRYGGPETARRSLAKRQAEVGFGDMIQLGLGHLSLEYIVLEPVFKSLFSSAELGIARQRLKAAGIQTVQNG